MKSSTTTQNEEERLHALRCLNILDSQAEERYNRVARITQRFFQVPIAAISLVDKSRLWFKSKVGLDVDELSREISFCGHTILDSKVMVVEDAKKDERFNENPLVTGKDKIRFYAGCPLNFNGYNMGALCIIDNQPRQLNEEEIDTLQDFATLVEDELKNTAVSTTDELTGISNRRGFINIAKYSLNLSKRMNVPLSVFYIDIDGFKEINDNLSHSEGDKVLKEVANLLLKSVRKMDIVGRLGGDEFAILCTGMSKDDIITLRKNIEKTFSNYNNSRKSPHKIQLSIGAICVDPNDFNKFEDVLNLADQKMYEEKLKHHS